VTRRGSAQCARKSRLDTVCEFATLGLACHTTTREILQIVEIWLECSQQVSLDLSSAGSIFGDGEDSECLRPEADNSSGNSDRRTSMLADMMSMMAPTASAPAPKKRATKRKAKKAKKAAPKKAAKKKTAKRKVAKKAKKAAKKTAKRKVAKKAKKATRKKAAKKTAKRKVAKKAKKRTAKKTAKRKVAKKAKKRSAKKKK
jgi:hypothetical protein